MQTHVKDHLTGAMIPLRYVEPGRETALDEFDALAALAATADAIDAELDAMADGLIDEVHQPAIGMISEGFEDAIYDLENQAMDALSDVHEMIAKHATCLTRAQDGASGAPIRRVLELAD